MLQPSLKKIVWIGLAILLIAGCGGGEKETPGLSVPPTRTPAPAGQADQTAAPAQKPFEIISMGETVNQFLARSTAISPLDQAITFIQTTSENAPDCLKEQQFDLFFELAALRFPIMDLSAWQISAENFPLDALEQGIAAVVADVPELMPTDPAVLRVCLIPLPYIGQPVGEPSVQIRRQRPHMAAMGDLNAVALDGSTVLVLCSAGEDCLDDLPLHVERALSMAYQLRLSGETLQDIPPLSRLVYEGRADNFAVRRDPAIRFPWDTALTLEDEAYYWQLFRHALLDDGLYGYESITNMVYGVYTNERQFPAWGGLYVGDQIVRAYLDQFPDTSWFDLVALDPVDLFEVSGYNPPNAQTRLVE